ncbi:MAG: dihydrodipicolinate synthase family protein [Gemmatimonadota bacterium]
MSKIDLSGILVPVTTPFQSTTGDVDGEGFRGNLRSLLSHPVRGIVVGGSTGEAMLLDEAERNALLHVAREEVSEGRLLLAGTGVESTRATIRLTRRAADLGVDAVLVQPPSFYKSNMTPAVLREHYVAVADASPVPVILYQVPPKFSTVELATGLVGELAQHPNIVGIKDSRGVLDELAQLSQAGGPDFQVLVGNGAQLLGGLTVGSVGGILGVANLAPAECVALLEAHGTGDSQKAGALQEQVGPVHVEVVGKRGVAGVKHALDLLGLTGGRPRLPLVPLSENEKNAVADALRRGGLLD